MRRFTMPTTAWADARFATLQDATGWKQAKTLGVLVLLWAHTRQLPNGPCITGEQLRVVLGAARCKMGSVRDALVASGHLQLSEEGFVVVDNVAHFAAAAAFRDAGRRGGYQKHKTKRAPQAKVAKLKEPALTAEIWAAYKAGYLLRYGVEPISNAAVNSQLAKVVAYVGKEDAPRLAQFYLSHDGAYYTRCQHPVSAMLKDYVGLHTQMLRGAQVTENDVRAHSDSQRLEAQLRRFSS